MDGLKSEDLEIIEDDSDLNCAVCMDSVNFPAKNCLRCQKCYCDTCLKDKSTIECPCCRYSVVDATKNLLYKDRKNYLEKLKSTNKEIVKLIKDLF